MEIADGRRYDQIARLFHWLTAALMLLVIASGLTMVRLGPGADQNQLFDLHRAIGTTILATMVLRLIWRLTHPALPLPATISAPQRFAAEVVHWLLYGLILVQPLLGWLGSNAFGAPIHVFGLFDLPVLMAKDEALAKILFGAHAFTGYAIIAVVSLHIAAALYHLARGDGVMARMW